MMHFEKSLRKTIGNSVVHKYCYSRIIILFTETPRLEETCKISYFIHQPSTTIITTKSYLHPVPHPDKFDTSRDSDATTSVGNLFQHQITLSVNFFFLIYNQDLLWWNLRPLPLIFSHGSGRRDQSHLATTSLRQV